MELASEDTRPGALSGSVRPAIGRSGSPAPRPYRNELFTDPRRRWSAEERESLDRLLPVIHVELLKVAAVLVQLDQYDERLEASGLVQAALIRLAQRHGAQWRSRVEFFRWTATIMRHVLVNHFDPHRRGGAASHQDVDVRQVGLALLSVDDALRKLEQMERMHEDFLATTPMPPRPYSERLR